MCSAFSGYIAEIPFILIDNFKNDLNKGAYFLSHFHADHVHGIRSSVLVTKLIKNNVFIYASKVTVAIINQECPLLSPCLKILDLGRNTITIKDEEEEIFLDVITLPAAHSLGSVMFIFEYNNKRILYTGDFRMARNSVVKYNHFHLKGEPIHIDVMYVDTTFQNIPSFPKRSEVVRNAVVHIQNWLNLSPEHRVMLITCAGYGYECVCNELYNATKLKTYVGDFYWSIYRQFPKELYGMTNDATSRIHLRTKYTYKEDPTPSELQVYFSAFKWGDQKNIHEDFMTCSRNRLEVCYSTHCGRDELVYFINYFNPKKIVGFPDIYNPDNKVCIEQDGFPSFKGSHRITPRKRKNAKDREIKVSKRVSKSLLEEAFDW